MNKVFATTGIHSLCVTFILPLSLVLSACSGTIFSSVAGVDNENVEAVYQVNPIDLSLTLVEGNADEEDAVAWNKAVSILPNDILTKYVVEYEVFTDGFDNSLASVANIESNETKWLFAIDYKDATSPNSTDFVTTLIHEFFHIVSLNDEQVDRDYDTCSQYEIKEGCTKEDSYLNHYYQTFWQDAPYYQDIQQEDTAVDLYDKRPNDFVNEYSSTNPVEDFAETFAFFVLSDKVTEAITIRDKKINFFYQYPELVEMRRYIRLRTNIHK